MNTKLSEAVYGCIFPGGLIPLKCKDNLPAIDHKIREIEVLATGQIIEGQGRRIIEKTVSAELTQRIVELRESENPPLKYSEIMDILGNQISPDAARDRYERHVKKVQQANANAEGYASLSGQAIQEGTYKTPVAVQEKIEGGDQFSGATKLIGPDKSASSDHPVEPNKLIDATLCNVAESLKIEGEDHIVEPNEKVIASNPTLRDCRIVEKSEKVALQEAKPEQAETSPKPSEEKEVSGPVRTGPEVIVREAPAASPDASAVTKRPSDPAPKERGKTDGPAIPHDMDDFILGLKDAGKSIKEVTDAVRSKGIDCSLSDVTNRIYQERKRRANESQAAGQPPKPAPKALSRRELDERIWAMHRQGQTPKQISDSLCAEGHYYGAQRVTASLRQQGASP
jgi:hypothetical protein